MHCLFVLLVGIYRTAPSKRALKLTYAKVATCELWSFQGASMMLSLAIKLPEHPLVIYLYSLSVVSIIWSLCKVRRVKSVNATTFCSKNLASLAFLQTSCMEQSLHLFRPAGLLSKLVQ